MRKFLLLSTLAAAAVIAAGISAQAQTYGPGMMGGGQYNGSHRGTGHGMMDGSGNTPGSTTGSGHGMMDGSGNTPGSTTGAGHGPGMMGDGSADDGDSRGQGNRNNRPCLNETDSQRGDDNHAPCSK